MTKMDLSKVRVFYQNKYDSINQNVVGIELLVRYNNVPRSHFIKSLPEEDLKVLTLYLISMASRYTFYHPNEFCSVNIGVSSLLDNDFVDSLCEFSKQLNFKNVILEVTENEISRKKTWMLMKKNMSFLISKGFTFSLDDYSTGQSHMVRLLYFPFEEVKISKEVFWRLYDNTDVKHFNRMINLFFDLNYVVVIDGVQTLEQLNFINTHFKVLVQGHYFGRPRPLNL